MSTVNERMAYSLLNGKISLENNTTVLQNYDFRGGFSMHLHGNTIAVYGYNKLYICDGYFPSNTTLKRLKALVEMFCVDKEMDLTISLKRPKQLPPYIYVKYIGSDIPASKTEFKIGNDLVNLEDVINHFKRNPRGRIIMNYQKSWCILHQDFW